MNLNEIDAGLARALDRRRMLQLGAAAGLSAALLPRLALAAESPDLLPQVRGVIEKWTGSGKFPGMIATIGLPGRDMNWVVRGTEGHTDADPVTPDSLFRIYSMSKPITGIAAMLLIEDGRLRLDQPISDLLPKYARMQVQKTYDGSITDLEPAKSPITVRQLMTHTSGLGYTIIQSGPIKTLMEDRGLIAGQISRLPVPGLERGKPVPSLTLFADGLAEVPLVYQPGTRWSYSLGLDLLGRVIEVASGRPFDLFLKERLFDPLGMTSTWFEVPRSEARRLTTNYGVLGGTFIPIDSGGDSIYFDKPAFPFGGSGLVSSPADYDRFQRMLAQRGKLGGRRIMSKRSVRLATNDLLPATVDRSSMTTGMMTGGADFGAGGRVGIGDQAGIFGWAGAAGTVAAVNMWREMRTSIFVQFMPPTSNSMLSEYQKALHTDIMALVKS